MKRNIVWNPCRLKSLFSFMQSLACILWTYDRHKYFSIKNMLWKNTQVIFSCIIIVYSCAVFAHGLHGCIADASEISLKMMGKTNFYKQWQNHGMAWNVNVLFVTSTRNHVFILTSIHMYVICARMCIYGYIYACIYTYMYSPSLAWTLMIVCTSVYIYT